MSAYTATANRPVTPYNTRIAITAGTPVTYAAASVDETLPYPIVLTAVPGGGVPAGTLLIEWQTASGGVWLPWPAGEVTTTTTYVLTKSIYALRFTANTRDAVVELAQ